MPDHTGGNLKLRAAGVTITGANVTGDIADASKGAAIIAHQAVLDRMSAAERQPTRRPRRCLAHRYVPGRSQNAVVQ